MSEKRKRVDWRCVAWHVGVRERNGRKQKWTLTSNEWFPSRAGCAEYIKTKIPPNNWDFYEYKPVKLVLHGKAAGE